MIALPRAALSLGVAKGAQVFVTSVGVTFGGLAGLELAGDRPALATVPITIMLVVSGMATLPIAAWLRRFGWRLGFCAGAAFGSVGAMVGAIAVQRNDFGLLCIGCGLLGVYHATVEYYRYAAADSVLIKDRGRAVSIVLAGGTLGAAVGPTLAIWSQGWFVLSFVGPFAAISMVLALVIPILITIDIPRAPTARRAELEWRSVSSLLRRPAFLSALSLSSAAWLAMAFLMTASPLAMVGCGISVGAAGLGIQAHLLAMFAPSFVTGYLHRRLGLVAIFLFACLAFVASAGLMVGANSFWLFAAGLAFLGLGWNFLYFVATMILVELPAADRSAAQALNEQISWVSTAGAAGLSGPAFFHFGWSWMPALAFVPLALILIVGFCMQSKGSISGASFSG